MEMNANDDDRYARAMKALGWVEGRITVDEGATVVDGQYATNDDWNGWLIVRMPLASVTKALDAAVASPYAEVLRYEVTSAGLLRVWLEDAPVDEYGPDEDGLYHLGSRAWCWELGADSPGGDD